MKRTTTARDLHLRTSGILTDVANGETFDRGTARCPDAEIRPFTRKQSAARMPDREKFLRRLPLVRTSGKILRRGPLLNLYFDSAYIAKCYLNEPDGQHVRGARERGGRPEFLGALHRRTRLRFSSPRP